MEEKRNYSFKNSDGEIMKLTVRRPNNKEIEDADIEYSKAFFNALKKGLPTRMVLSNILSASGAWTQENDNEIVELERQEALLSTKESKGREKKRTDEKLSEIEEKLRDLRRIRNSYFSHCAESVASDAQRDYLVFCTTYYTESGESVWKNYEDFVSENDGAVLFRTTYEYLTFSSDVPSTIPNEDEDVKKEEEKEVSVVNAEETTVEESPGAN